MKVSIPLLLLIVIAFAGSLLAGRVWLPPQAILSASPDSLAGLIVHDIRLPRTVLALITGGVLGLSGAVLQGFTRNPLAEPALLGVSSGAALGAVIAIYFGLAAISVFTGPLMGIAGAILACALTFALGQGWKGGGTVALVLAGAAVSSLTAAGIARALNFAPSPYAAYEMAVGLACGQKLEPGSAGASLRRRWMRPAGADRPRPGCAIAGRDPGGKPGL
jgi:iron complex transport system permease protein